VGGALWDSSHLIALRSQEGTMSRIHRTRISRILWAVGLVALLIGAGACATTHQTRSTETRGFLGDYSQLGEDESDRVALVYVNPDADWSKYKAVMIDSVTVWHDTEDSKISEETAQMLTDHFYAALHDELAKDYRMVDQPGPGVMRVRAAVTETKGAKVIGNAVTSIHLGAKVASTAIGNAADVQVWVGSATFEGEVRDSMTDLRLIAAVDQRSGTKNPFVGLKKWSQVRRVMDVWSENLRERLSELRGS
jgi:hypothetical protein